jgi:hypothetical protein|tara:strand:+ start:479 stop:721 length:243 start_codon:yes stop_codon:yes gene_type:complete
MKEPERIPLDPSTPRIQDVEKRPLPSLQQENDKTYPEPMSDDVTESAEQAFGNFIQKAKESKKKYDLWLQEKEKESKDST